MKTITRDELIRRLRTFLLQFVDDEHTMCDAAASRGIFCKGYRRYTDRELRERFDWIARTRPGISRVKLEEVISKYKLARQEVLDVPLTCDAQMHDRDTCMGWDEFTDGQLADFHKEWFGEEVRVAPPRGSGPGPA